MPTRTREQVMNALFALLRTAGGTNFKLYSRRWVAWMDDPLAERPALPMLVQWESPDGEMYDYRGARGLPPVRTWKVYVMIYANRPPGNAPGVPDGTTPAATVLNPLIDIVDAALMGPDNRDPGTGALTLGGLVVDCRIEGEIVKALGGDTDPSGFLAGIIPVNILVQ